MIKNDYEIRDNGNSRTILFIHGAGVTRTWWQPQMADLAADFRVIAIDLPGHGMLADIPFKMENAIEHIHRVTDAEIGSRFLLVGISLGGYLAINYAHRYTDCVAGLFLSGCTINMSGVRGLSFRLTGLILKRKGPDWLERVTIESYRKRIEAALIEPVIADGIYAKAAIEAFFQLSGRNYHRMLKAYPGPIMIANGENDEPNRKAEKSLRKHNDRFISSPIKNASHLTNLEQPTVFSASIQEFATQLSWN